MRPSLLDRTRRLQVSTFAYVACVCVALAGGLGLVLRLGWFRTHILSVLNFDSESSSRWIMLTDDVEWNGSWR